MAQADPSNLKTVTTLIGVAKRQPAAALPNETHQSYPIPLIKAGRLRIAFLYCPSHLSPGEGLLLRAPSYFAEIDAQTGTFEELREIQPGEFGQGHAPGEVIGKFALSEGLSQEEFLEKKNQLYKHYDLLLPAFVASTASVSADLKPVAREFGLLFSQVTEEPLRPYYRAAGRAFFAWLETASE